MQKLVQQGLDFGSVAEKLDPRGTRSARKYQAMEEGRQCAWPRTGGRTAYSASMDLVHLILAYLTKSR